MPIELTPGWMPRASVGSAILAFCQHNFQQHELLHMDTPRILIPMGQIKFNMKLCMAMDKGSSKHLHSKENKRYKFQTNLIAVYD